MRVQNGKGRLGLYLASSRSASLQKKQQRLVRGGRLTMHTGTDTARDKPKRVAGTGWAQSPLGKSTRDCPRPWLVPACALGHQQWDVSCTGALLDLTLYLLPDLHVTGLGASVHPWKGSSPFPAIPAAFA